MACLHELSDREASVYTEGLCPLCLLAENKRLRDALIQVRGFAHVMAEHNWRDLRLHIERQCDILNRLVEQLAK